MLGDLFVVLKAKIGEYLKGIKEAVGITQGAAKTINNAASSIDNAWKGALSGDLRNNINQLNEQILLSREYILGLKNELKSLQSQQLKQKAGTEEYKKTANEIKRIQKELFLANQELTEFNILARDQKTALANSRLSAEDNSTAMEAMSRTVNAASQALLLLNDSSDTLKPVLKTLSIAMAGISAIVAIQNLRLRENAIFTKTAAAAQLVLEKATIGATAATTAFKTALATFGVGALLLALQYVVMNFDKIKEALSSVSKEQKLYNNFLDEFSKSSSQAISDQAKFQVQTKSYLSVINNVNASEKQKLNAYEELQKLVPALTNYTLKQAQSNGVLNSSIEKQIQLFALQAKAIALQNALISEEEIKIKAEQQRKAIEEFNNPLSRRNQLTKQYNQLSAGQKQNQTLQQFIAQKNAIDGYNESLSESSDLFNQLLSVQLQISKLTENTNKKTSSGKTSSKAQKKDVEQIIDLQKDLSIIEAELNRDRLLSVTTDEVKRAEIISNTEKDIFDIKKSSVLQQINAQNLSATKSKEILAQLAIDQIKIEQDAIKRISEAKNKKLDEDEQREKNRYEDSVQGNEKFIDAQQELFDVLKAGAAKEYSDGIISYDQYQQRLKEIEVDALKDRIAIKRKFGQDVLKDQQALAEAEYQLAQSKNQKLTKEEIKFAQKTSQILQNSFNQLGRVVSDGINNSLENAFTGMSETSQIEIDILKQQQQELEANMKDSTKSQLEMLQMRRQYLENEAKLAEETQSNLSKLFQTILVGVADFLQQLGIGLIAAALATEAFQKTLLSNPLVAAAAGAAAVVASAGVRAVLAKGVKFADGGIVSGPTLGLVGEYPGASTNPEVIAPLDKLRSIIGDTGNGDNGFIAETRISGRDLAIVLNRYNTDSKR